MKELLHEQFCEAVKNRSQELEGDLGISLLVSAGALEQIGYLSDESLRDATEMLSGDAREAVQKELHEIAKRPQHYIPGYAGRGSAGPGGMG